ncbi:MAG: adenosyl-hopene transferase HpnH [Planctomycetia bacterium]|nr:adenosyl-hopene transferase HpnH [Planctomycetia bacterium]
MKFPLSLSLSMGRYLLKKRLLREKYFPLVLMLEPLFTCNLHCAGCGRIREYADHMREILTLEECLESITSCGAPVISICGGEPLLYPEISELVRQSTDVLRRHVYLCTNGVLLEEKIHEKIFKPSTRFFINVHLDGLQENHDASTGRTGVFEKAVTGIKSAVHAGFQVCTNTTLYKESSLDEIVELCEMLESLGVSRLMLAPAYSYEMFDARNAETLFLEKTEIHRRFQELERRLKGRKLAITPLYMDFLTGRREIPCAAWANPTRNVCGWKGPCYLITDGHYKTYRQMVEATDWEKLGPAGSDTRCKNCMMHCGFEPGAVLAANKSIWQTLRLAYWQMGK